MREPLPTFRFHPDPVQSGAVEPSPEPCGCCGKARGHVYTGPCYVEGDFDTVLCPWCIADGSAFRRFGVTFADIEPQPDFDPRIAAELEERTPGITTWNPIDWPACCKTPMAYLEPAGHAELTARHAELTAALPAWGATELDMTPDEATQLCQRLQRDHAPTAHVFRCLVCRRPRAVFDFD